MKWVAIALLFLLIAALEGRVLKNEAEMRVVAVEEACRTIVEAKLVRSCSIQK